MTFRYRATFTGRRYHLRRRCKAHRGMKFMCQSRLGRTTIYGALMSPTVWGSVKGIVRHTIGQGFLPVKFTIEHIATPEFRGA